MHLHRLLLSAAILFLPAQAAELARWTVTSQKGIQLVKAQDAQWTVEGSTAAVTPLHDYYRRASLLLHIDATPKGPVWLSLGYLDQGYSLITLTPGVPDRDQHGVVRLNTGKLRHATFRIEKPVFDHDLRVQGITRLQSITLTDTEPAVEPMPDVKPAVTLHRPLDLVISSGADANTLEGVTDSLATMRNLFPLAKAMGFNGIESYVKWNFIERNQGTFDWSFYDTLLDEMDKNNLRWFPLLVAGSAYALPKWFFQSPDMIGYKCLEHNTEIEIPTIFSNHQEKYVRAFLSEFGKHYAARKTLLGVRLGPSANYGEAQYPATGGLGFPGRGLHTHLGYWAGDQYASIAFRRWLQARYSSIDQLNDAWATKFRSFDEVKTFLPSTALTARMRVDFNNWYMGAMTEWCEKWATWARQALPDATIYQSSGGWGAVEIGTDYAAQAKSMAALKGGIRLTNENDSYLNNVGATRLAASAAKFYGAKVGYEPAGFSSVRGVMARLYNAITTGAEHLFYYHGNLYTNDEALDAWVKHAPLLDQRAPAANEIAVFYPDTDHRVNDEVLRHLHGSVFFAKIQPLRSVTDYDFVSEQMILDGALDKFKVLIFAYASMTEKPVLDRIAQWIRNGGVAIYPERQHLRDGGFGTVEGDHSVYKQWQGGDTGKGKLIFYRGHPEPVHYYIDFLRAELPKLECLSPQTRAALRMLKPQETYWSILSNGKLALLNYDDAPATIRLTNGRVLTMPPYTIRLE